MSKLKTLLKVAGYVTGFTPAASLLRSTGEAVGGSIGHIGSVTKAAAKAAVKDPERLPEVPADMSAEDRFWTYMQRYRKGPEHLPALRAQTHAAAWTSAFGTVLFIGMLPMFPFGLSMLTDAARLIVPAALAGNACRHAYANWLFRREAHGGFRDFVHSGDWMPRR